MIHSERAHALLSASGSKRWMACTPSAREEDKLPEESSIYADEGTKGHELSEYRLAERMGWELDEEKLAVIQESEYYCDSMEDYIEKYCDSVMEKYVEMVAEDSSTIILLERRLNYSEWVPEGFGTGDVVLINKYRIVVIDLKYGKGVVVSAVENPQMQLYGLGAIAEYNILYDFETVEVYIIQPRLDAISDWSISVEDLLKWADGEVVHRAAMAWEGKGDFVPGDHCQFCKINATCRARAEKNLELARLEFAKPNTLSLEEIGEILGQAMQLSKWATNVKEYADDQAVNKGMQIPGWKLVEGKSNRCFADKSKVQDKLDLEGYMIDDVAPRKMEGITALEKLVGKKMLGKILGDLIQKPAGKPVLVVESDKRQEWRSAAAEFSALE